MIRTEKQVPLDKFFDFSINIRVKSFVDSWFNFCQVRPVNKRFDPFTPLLRREKPAAAKILKP